MGLCSGAATAVVACSAEGLALVMGMGIAIFGALGMGSEGSLMNRQ